MTRIAPFLILSIIAALACQVATSDALQFRVVACSTRVDPIGELPSQAMTQVPAFVPNVLRVLGEEETSQQPRYRVEWDSSTSPATPVPASPETALPSPYGSGLGPEQALGPNSFTLFRNQAIPNFPSFTTSPDEPSLAVDGSTVFVTGNWFTGVSQNGGQSFSFINPYDNFPSDGVDDPINNGFCCDQVVYYNRDYKVTLWLLQYVKDANTNTQRLAVANTRQKVQTNSWSYYDLSPALFGFPAGYWFDFPDISCDNRFAFLTTNVLAIGNPFAVGALIVRIPLSQLASGSSLSLSYFFTNSPNLAGLRGTHGAGTAMYFGTHKSNVSLRVYSWPDTGNTIFYADITHPSFNVGTMVAPGPDGRDWAGSADVRVLGAWEAQGVLGFMWNASQGGAFPYPHIQVLRIRKSDYAFLSQQQIWSSAAAFMYPSVSPNNRGHLGGTICYGGGLYYPSMGAWIADDINGGSFVPLEYLTFAAGTSGPTSNRWGDFFTTRRNDPYVFTWAASGYSLNGGSGDGFLVPKYLWFGRQRDVPTVGVEATKTNPKIPVIVLESPSPSGSALSVRLENLMPEKSVLAIVRPSGQEVLRRELEVEASSTRRISLNLSGMASGAYFVVLRSPTHVASKAFVYLK